MYQLHFTQHHCSVKHISLSLIYPHIQVKTNRYGSVTFKVANSIVTLKIHFRLKAFKGCHHLDPFCCPTQFTHTETFFSVSLQALGITKRKINCDPADSFWHIDISRTDLLSLNMPCKNCMGKKKNLFVKRMSAQKTQMPPKEYRLERLETSCSLFYT